MRCWGNHNVGESLNRPQLLILYERGNVPHDYHSAIHIAKDYLFLGELEGILCILFIGLVALLNRIQLHIILPPIYVLVLVGCLRTILKSFLKMTAFWFVIMLSLFLAIMPVIAQQLSASVLFEFLLEQLASSKGGLFSRNIVVPNRCQDLMLFYGF